MKIERPNEENKKQAKTLANQMGAIKNSITKGEGNAAGFLAEIVVSDILKAKRKSTKDYDIIDKEGKTIDVKTKRTKVAPLSYYECSIAETSLHQVCDYYVFTRCLPDGTLYILGDYKQDEYFKNARKLIKGEKDGDNGFIVKANCFNLPISELKNELRLL